MVPESMLSGQALNVKAIGVNTESCRSSLIAGSLRENIFSKTNQYRAFSVDHGPCAIGKLLVV